MFVLLTNFYLIFDKDDILKLECSEEPKSFSVFNLNENSSKLIHIQWPPSIIEPSKNISFICGAFSKVSNFLALSDNNKNVVIFDKDFTLINQFQLKKNIIKMVFGLNHKLFVSDKSGDIYEFQLKLESDSQKPFPNLLLGHCSMLLDFIITPDEKYIISCDRDEKIRVTFYPNTFDICAFCLGHKEFVSVLKLINNEVLISGSGDGRFILWDFVNGTSIFSYDCSENITENKNCFEKTICSKKSDFAIKSLTLDRFPDSEYLCASFYQKPDIYLFKIIYENQKVCHLDLVFQKSDFDYGARFISFDFCHSNFLWVIGTSSHRDPIQLFELNNGKLTEALTRTTVPMIELLTNNQRLFEAIAEDHRKNYVQYLFKNYYNNVELYYHKKKQRVETEKSNSSHHLY